MGNSLGVVIPSSVVKELGLEKGQDINVEFQEATNQLIFTDKEKKEASSCDVDLLHQVVENAVEKALQKRENKN